MESEMEIPNTNHSSGQAIESPRPALGRLGNLSEKSSRVKSLTREQFDTKYKAGLGTIRMPMDCPNGCDQGKQKPNDDYCAICDEKLETCKAANRCCPHDDGEHVLRYCTIPDCGCRRFSQAGATRQVAERILSATIGKVKPQIYADMVDAIVEALESRCDGIQSQLTRKEQEIEAERTLKWIHFENAAKFDQEVCELKRQMESRKDTPDHTSKWQEWNDEFPLADGWYWMRKFRHYRPLPVEIENGSLFMMFGTGHYSQWDVKGAEFFPLSLPANEPERETESDQAGT